MPEQTPGELSPTWAGSIGSSGTLVLGSALDTTDVAVKGVISYPDVRASCCAQVHDGTRRRQLPTLQFGMAVLFPKTLQISHHAKFLRYVDQLRLDPIQCDGDTTK